MFNTLILLTVVKRYLNDRDPLAITRCVVNKSINAFKSHAVLIAEASRKMTTAKRAAQQMMPLSQYPHGLLSNLAFNPPPALQGRRLNRLHRLPLRSCFQASIASDSSLTVRVSTPLKRSTKQSICAPQQTKSIKEMTPSKNNVCAIFKKTFARR